MREPVGRDAIQRLLHAAVVQPGSFIVLTGEAGIGKTTLLADAAAHAQRAAWGWGWRGEGAPAYWPWRQMFRDLDLSWPEAAERFQLFDEACSALLAESRVQPTVLLFDDLHWADESSLLLLEFLARRLPAGALTILGAQRDGPPAPAGALAMPLRGLSVEAIAQLTGDPAAAAVTHRRTGGNPFLAQQLTWSGLPGATQWLRERLSGLDEGVLGAAAALGPTFSVALLATVCGFDVTDAVAAATRARVTVQTGPDEFRFVHDLFWELLADQPAAVHHRVAEALAAQGNAPPSEIAAHFVRADPGSPEAHKWSTRAAEDADRRLAYEDAVRHWANAFAAAPDRADTLLALSHARHLAGDLDGARAGFLGAAELSRCDPGGEHLAAAALGLHALGSRPGDELISLLREAISVTDGATRVRLTAALAREQAWQGGDPDAPVAIAQRAVAAARALNDPGVLAEALVAQHNTLWLPGRAARRLELAAEVTEAGGSLALEAHLLAATDLLELADPRFRAEIDIFVRLAEASGQPRLRYAALVRRGFLATLAGRLGEAERFVESAHHLGTECGVPGADLVYADQLWWLRSEQGRLAEFADTPLPMPETDPHSAPVLGTRALVLLAAGRRDEAEAVIAVLTSSAPSIESGRNSLLDCAHATELTVAFGQLPMAKWLYEFLEPYAGTTVVSGAAISFHGAVDHHLGRLASLLGRQRDAERHALAAREIHARLGVRRASTVAKGQFKREGPVWTVEFAGRLATVKDAKGLRDLATLLAAPGRDVAAVRLLGLGAAPGGDEILDEKARNQVRARLVDLEEEIAEAEEWNDPERAARARDERDALLHELARALGLGGRARRLGDEAERARKAVTARIRDAIIKIHAVHPALAEHLSASITTGTHCAYLPAEPVAWRI